MSAVATDISVGAPALRDDAAVIDGPAVAARLNESYAGLDAHAALSRALLGDFAGRIALVSSFGAEAAVLLHLVARIDPATPVLFIDTGKHFAQTLIYRRNLASQLGLSAVTELRAPAEDIRAADPDGTLWRRDADACCALRKVAPLDTGLQRFAAWITGRKQFHGGLRSHLPAVEWSGQHFKINPLRAFGPAELAAYMQAHDLPAHPLVAQGFPSIGCWPCTHPVAPGAAERDGRWRGQDKTECGIHRPAPATR